VAGAEAVVAFVPDGGEEAGPVEPCLGYWAEGSCGAGLAGRSAGCPCRAGSGVLRLVVQEDGLEVGFGDSFCPVQDGVDRGPANDVGEAAEHAAGAAVEELAVAGQRAGLVVVQGQGPLEGGDERTPVAAFGFAAEGERPGGEDGEPAGDLAAAGPAEQPGLLDFHAGVDEGGGDLLGEVLELVGNLGAGAGGEVEVVYLIGFTDRRSVDTGSELRRLLEYMSVLLVQHPLLAKQIAAQTGHTDTSERRSTSARARVAGR
jgi:hypothetical protein